MKLAVYDELIPGVIVEDRIYDVSSVASRLEQATYGDPLLGVIESWDEVKKDIQAVVKASGGKALSEVRLRAPLSRPSKILCAAANYKEGIPDNVSELEFFHKSPTTIIGDGDTIVLPNTEVTIVHHEMELAVVIGKPMRNATLENAMDCVFGYTILLDVSARGIKRNGLMVFFNQKNWDTFAPIGPGIVTADEIDDPQNLQVRLWANGELRQDYNTSDMAHQISSLIVQASEINTLLPGDIIATGCNLALTRRWPKA